MWKHSEDTSYYNSTGDHGQHFFFALSPPDDLCPDSNAFSIASFFVLQLDFAYLDGPHRDGIATHCSCEGVLDNLAWLAPVLSFLRLTLFKTPMMGQNFPPPRTPTQTNLAMCPNLVSHWNEQVCDSLLKSGIVQ